MRLAVLCTVAILVLGTTFALYRHIQNNSQGASIYTPANNLSNL